MRFHIVATIWKESNTLQVIISLRNTGITEMTRRRGRYIQQVVYPQDVTKYDQNMDVID